MKTAAIYCRVSTEDQEREGTSLQSQQEACATKAKGLGYEVPVENIFRESWTGSTMDRPKLDEVRSLINQRLTDCLICYSTDRLARNPIHIAIIAEECEKHSVELIFVTEPLDRSPEGALIRYVKGYAAQIEREKIRERTLRGKREKARQGKLATGGRCLFGYDIADGKRAVKPAEAELVKQIFEWFASQRYTLYRAANELNKAQTPAPRGAKWTEHTIYRLLINPAYKGVTYAFRYKVVEPKHPKIGLRRYAKTTHQFRDSKEWIEVPGATPPIIDTSTWDLAQQQLSLNRVKSPRNRKHQYLFINGRFRCGICGRAMIGSCKKKPKGDWLFYRCVSNVKSNYYEKCPQHSIAASTAESLVWDEVAKVLKNPSLVMEELSSQRNEGVQAITEVDRMLVEERLRQASREEQRYLRLYGQGKLDEHLLLAETQRIRREKETLQAKLAEFEAQQKAFQEADVRLEKMPEVLAMLSECLCNFYYCRRQTSIDVLEVKVTLHPDRVMHINGSIPQEVQLSSANS
jgi:site-specific DNA recombinase